MSRLRVAWLPDGKRLHLKNGVVNVIIQAFGRPGEIGRAYDAAIARARALMQELEVDLPRLEAGTAPAHPAARRAVAAVAGVPGALHPLTALTGAVADEILTAMTHGALLERGFANNHGNVALHLAEGQSISPEVLDWPEFQRYATKVSIPADSPTRGLAAAGWRYEGFALGCADRIFTAAPTAAVAEAALGAIAAAMVPPGVPAVAARDLAQDNILGSLPVYPPMKLNDEQVTTAFVQGSAVAAKLFEAELITLGLITLGRHHSLAAGPHRTVESLFGLDD